MPIDIIVTDAGRAALVNAENTGTDPVEITEVGLSAAVITPTTATAVLTGEIKRVTALAGDVVAPDTIHVTMTDESADAYTLRAFALYLADGTLFAIYGQPGAILEKTAASIGLLAIDCIFADIAAALLTFGATDFINPAATTERAGVVELATVAEAQAGTDAVRAITAVGGKAAVLGWLLAVDGPGSALDADLLDGQHGAYFADIPARLGYTPANRAGDTFTGNVTVQRALAGAAIAKVENTLTGPAVQARFDWATGTVNATVSASLVDNGGAPYFGFFSGYGLNTFVWDAEEHRLRNRAGAVLLICSGAQLTYLGSTVWHGGNDGAGSGMDADLLDGQHGAYYADVPARLGFTPLNAASYTAADVRTKLLTVDGAGSAIDADLLDGQHGAYYADVPARLGFTPLNAASYTAADVLAKALTVDGAGSGLDADLLDGKHAAAFAELTEFTRLIAGSGHYRLPGGLIFQWGSASQADNSGAQAVVFPLTFPTACIMALATNDANAAPSAFHGTGALSAAGFTVYSATATTVPAPAGVAFFWFAIGH